MVSSLLDKYYKSLTCHVRFASLCFMLSVFFLQVPACVDIDADGIPNRNDNCPVVANEDQLDRDSDEVGDVCDNCPNHSNPYQMDSDDDGRGNACKYDNTLCEKDFVDSESAVCDPMGMSCGADRVCCTYWCIADPIAPYADCYCVDNPAPDEFRDGLLLLCRKIDCVE